MKTPSGPRSTFTSATFTSDKLAEPKLPALDKMPTTPLELFRSLALTVKATINQPHPHNNKSPKKQDYALPWAGFSSWRDARERLGHFEKAFNGKIIWAPFNDSLANDGPMSLNAYPGRALIERVTNEGDANLEAAALNHKGPMPKSPAEAAEQWFKLGPGVLAGDNDDELRDIARKTVTVSGWVGNQADHKDLIFDARDFGIGLTSGEMPSTILSLNRGNKKSKPWLTGKHGQGASSTYQYTDLTLIASRKIGSKCAAFTFVEATWDSDNGILAKTPTYRYLTIDGKIPEVEVSESDFPSGTLVRHIGYNAADLFSLVGQHSLYGLLLRSIAQPLFPVWVEMFSLHPGSAQGYPTFSGYRRYGRLIRGTVNALERAWKTWLKPATSSNNGVEGAADETIDSDDPEEQVREVTGKILHRASEYYQLPKWDFGGRNGIGEIGRVKITYWVVDPDGRASSDVLRNWVDPDKTILMTLDGQTHAEESRAIVSGHHGAKLWAVGRYMIVQIDCDYLDTRAKYEMFTSTREHAKETPIKKMILEELVRRLGFDTKLQELNTQLAAADIKAPENKDDTIASLIKKYLKAAGINFEQLVRKVEKWTEVDSTKDVPAAKVEHPEPPPIEAVEPPTFVRWKFKGESIKLYPGQRYSFVFETDAAPSYWNPADQTASKIRVLSFGVNYVGAGEMKGGRVRCHFQCPENAAVGTKGYIQVQLDYAMGAAKTHRLQVEIIERTKEHKEPYKPTEKKAPEQEGESKQTITVKIRKKDFSEVQIPVVQPIPVKREDPLWQILGWPIDPHRVGFSIRSQSGKIHLYYNAQFPPFLDLRHKMSKKSLEAEFVRRYELKLVLHTIFTLNYEFVDEEDFGEEQKKQVRHLLCATAESLALATKSELEIESRLKSEDNIPLETTVASNLQEAATSASQDGAL